MLKSIRCICVLLVLAANPAWAQDTGEWDWRIAPYLWAVGMKGDIAIGDITQEVDVSFSDILSDFELGGSLFVGLGKGNHAVHFDYTYIRLRPDPTVLPAPPFPPETELASKTTINIFETAYNYRWNGADVGPSLVVGARLMDIKMRMSPDGLPAVESGPDWWDYFVGVKTYHSINDKWDFNFYGTIGTGGSDLPWTLQGIFGRKFSNGNRLGLGFRVWGVDYSQDNAIMDERTTLDLTFYGLMLGYEFN